ncbi:hypothetical protein CPB86DRAFT_799036 [Serendipita vermifera]|nr:hypothetical protein CPB86DRAFT_799036 [Serendipita vermifera]
MVFGSGDVSGNSTIANSTVVDDAGVPTGLEYDIDTTIGLYASHIGVKCAFAAFLTLTVYEMAITFDCSVNLFWKQRWNMNKALFLLNRIAATFILCVLTIGNLSSYPCDFGGSDPFVYHMKAAYSQALPTLCRAAPWIAFFGSNVLLLVVNLSLLMRINALWYRRRGVIYFSWSFFAINLLTQITVQPYIISTAICKAYKHPFTGCSVTITFKQTYIIFLTGIAFETCMVALTIIRSYPIARSNREISFTAPLWRLLLQDGIFYYICIIGVQVFTVILSSSPQNTAHSVPAILSYLPFVVPGIACNRLFIRLQTALLVKEGTIMETNEGISGDTGDSELTVLPSLPRGFERRRHQRSISTDLYVP